MFLNLAAGICKRYFNNFPKVKFFRFLICVFLNNLDNNY